MNPPTDNAPPPAAADDGRHDARPVDWREALMSLIASRIALIQLEARETARQRARCVIGLLVAAVCLFFSWALLLAGGIAAVSTASGCPWYWLAIGAAAFHLLLALLLLKGSSAKPAAPAFPLTRAEFQKDREWIENFQKKPK